MPDSEFVIRPVGLGDLDAVCRHRAMMFLESGREVSIVDRLSPPFREWAAERLADGRYFGWVAEFRGLVVAGLGMMELDWPPHPMHPENPRRGYILNVYVEQDFRRRGLARRLMLEAEAEAHRRGLSYLVLHATDDGRALYQRLGWSGGSSEMSLELSAR
jgi:ribosomal protein S18 acetylase RimI-like enzyme